MVPTVPRLVRRHRRHRSDPLPPPRRENWLGLGLMASTAFCVPLATYRNGFPPGNEGLFSLVAVIALVAFYSFLGLGTWLVRPKQGRELVFRIAFAPLLLQGAIYLLFWGQGFATRSPRVMHPRSAIDLAATIMLMVGFIPALVLWLTSRDGRLLFIAESIIPAVFVVTIVFVLLPRLILFGSL